MDFWTNTIFGEKTIVLVIFENIIIFLSKPIKPKKMKFGSLWKNVSETAVCQAKMKLLPFRRSFEAKSKSWNLQISTLVIVVQKWAKMDFRPFFFSQLSSKQVAPVVLHIWNPSSISINSDFFFFCSFPNKGFFVCSNFLAQVFEFSCIGPNNVFFCFFLWQTLKKKWIYAAKWYWWGDEITFF